MSFSFTVKSNNIVDMVSQRINYWFYVILYMYKID